MDAYEQQLAANQQLIANADNYMASATQSALARGAHTSHMFLTTPSPQRTQQTSATQVAGVHTHASQPMNMHGPAINSQLYTHPGYGVGPASSMGVFAIPAHVAGMPTMQPRPGLPAQPAYNTPPTLDALPGAGSSQCTNTSQGRTSKYSKEHTSLMLECLLE